MRFFVPNSLAQAKSQAGYVALTTVLVIMAVLILLSGSVTILSIDEGQAARGSIDQEQALAVAEGCVGEVLLELNEDGTVPASVVLPEGTCSVTLDSQAGIVWTFTVSATVDNHTSSIQVTAERDTTVLLTSWQEV